MARINKRPDGRYQMNVYIGRVDGKKKYRTVYGVTQKETQAKAAELRVRLGKGIDITAEADSFAAWAARWLVIKKSEVPAAQYNLCKSRANVLISYLGSERLIDINVTDIQQVINSLAAANPRTGKPSAKKTLRDYKQIVSQIFSTAIQSRAVDYNPAEYVKVPHDAPQAYRRALSEEERGWIDSTEHRARTAAMIMLYAGLRRGEVAALTWNDIDLESGTISVTKSITYKGDTPRAAKSPKTDAGTRIIPIPDRLKKYLTSVPRNSFLVVTSAKGQQMTESGWKRMWESYMSVLNEQHGVHFDGVQSRFDPKGMPITIERFSMHCLRHTYCTMLYESGVDVLVAKQLMGHSDIKTTLGIYTHLSQAHAASDALRLNEYLDGQNRQGLVKE